MTQKEYDDLMLQINKANRENDYNNMIMPNNPIYNEMRKFKQDNICTHGSISTNGVGDICNYCGKTF